MDDRIWDLIFVLAGALCVLIGIGLTIGLYYICQ